MEANRISSNLDGVGDRTIDDLKNRSTEMSAWQISESNNCPDNETLHAFEAGLLSESELNRVSDHLTDCPDCIDKLSRMQADDHVIRGLRSASKDGRSSEDFLILERVKSRLGDSVRWTTTAEQVTRLGHEVKQLGPFEIIGPLGEGGMGNIYRVRHTHLGKVMALKVLSPKRMANAKARARFELEMKAIGQLDHPNIVGAHHAEVEGVPFIAMELVEGIDLNRLVRSKGPMRIPDACQCVRQAALALQHAHEIGLVHRDVKPSNLMLTRHGDVKLLDLGLAMVQGESNGEVIASNDRKPVVGTIDYMAPEQMSNCFALDIRADLYSLGCTLYHLLTGAPPERDSDGLPLDEVPNIRDERSEVPEQLAVVITKLLAHQPENRFHSPSALMAALEPFCVGSRLWETMETTPTPSSQSFPQSSDVSSQKQSSSAWLYLPCFLLSLALAAWFVWRFPASQESIRVESFHVTHVQDKDQGELALVKTGKRSFQSGDSIGVEATLSSPAYAYLLLVEPGGSSRLLYPPEDDALPQRVRRLEPANLDVTPTHRGLYAVALLVADQPLPSYDKWSAALDSHDWPAEPIGLWRYDGRIFHYEPSDTAANLKPSVPAGLSRFCKTLKNLPGVTALRLVAFYVDGVRSPKETASP